MFTSNKIKIQIKSYFGSVLFEAEKENYTVRQALQDAVLQGAVLQGAVLRGADLRGAVLRGADLQGAVLQDADLQGADLRGAVLQGADLRGADLQGAVLQDADLRGAKNIPQEYINQCSRDIIYVLSYLKKEVPFLREQLIAGNVDGRTYVGDCACLLGTLTKADIAKATQDDVTKVCGVIPFYDKGLHNFGEQWFFQIRPGDTPQNSEFAAHALKLIDMILGTVEAKKKVGRKKKAA